MATSSTLEKNDDGTNFIPASQRPDGTWRKPRRVKDGYVPQEEVPLYESKGKQWAKGKPSHPVGYYQEAARADSSPRNTARNPIPGLTIDTTADEVSKSKKKKKKKPAVDGEIALVSESLKKAQLNWPGSDKEALTTLKTQPNPAKVPSSNTAKLPPKDAPTAIDPAKRLKNLKKRLREVEQLEQKISSGELKKPDKDQLEKLKRRDDLQEQIADLEAELGL